MMVSLELCMHTYFPFLSKHYFNKEIYFSSFYTFYKIYNLLKNQLNISTNHRVLRNHVTWAYIKDHASWREHHSQSCLSRWSRSVMIVGGISPISSSLDGIHYGSFDVIVGPVWRGVRTGEVGEDTLWSVLTLPGAGDASASSPHTDLSPVATIATGLMVAALCPDRNYLTCMLWGLKKPQLSSELQALSFRGQPKSKVIISIFSLPFFNHPFTPIEYFSLVSWDRSNGRKKVTISTVLRRDKYYEKSNYNTFCRHYQMHLGIKSLI